jgi:hypothetical protein
VFDRVWPQNRLTRCCSGMVWTRCRRRRGLQNGLNSAKTCSEGSLYCYGSALYSVSSHTPYRPPVSMRRPTIMWVLVSYHSPHHMTTRSLIIHLYCGVNYEFKTHFQRTIQRKLFLFFCANDLQLIFCVIFIIIYNFMCFLFPTNWNSFFCVKLLLILLIMSLFATLIAVISGNSVGNGGDSDRMFLLLSGGEELQNNGLIQEYDTTSMSCLSMS